MEIKKRLGKRIQDLRIKNNLKQSELAEKIGLATKSQSCIETGKSYPTADNIEKYAKVFNIDVSEIFDIGHIQPQQKLYEEIITMLKNATEKELITSYRVLKSILR